LEIIQTDQTETIDID